MAVYCVPRPVGNAVRWLVFLPNQLWHRADNNRRLAVRRLTGLRPPATSGYSCMIECNGTSLRTVWRLLPQMDSSPAETSADYNIDYTDTTIVYTVRAAQVITLPSALLMGIEINSKL